MREAHILWASAALCVACASGTPTESNGSTAGRVIVYGQVLEGVPEGRLVIVRLFEQLPIVPPAPYPPQCQQGNTLDAGLQLLDATGQFRIELRTATSVVNACVQVVAEPNLFDGAHSRAGTGYLPVTIRVPPAPADSVQATLTLPYQS